MKFLVVYTNRNVSGAGGSFGASSNFISRSRAVESASRWAQLGSTAYAFLWDGSTWTEYAPTP
jgi:hypothetical protein